MKLKESKPEESNVLEVEHKGYTVKIYRRTKGQYTYFQLADNSTGKRKLRSFANETDARDEAKRIAKLMASGDVLAAQMTGEDRQRYVALLTIFKEIGIDPLAGAAEYVAAKKKLGPHSLPHAVDVFLAKHAIVTNPKPVKEAVDLMVAARRADKRSEVYLRDLETRLDTFAKSLTCNLDEVSSSDINIFLRSLKCGGRSRNNYRRAIVSLFKFGEAEKMVSRDHIISKEIALATEEKASVEIFTPEELTQLLSAVLYPTKMPGANNRYFEDQGMLPLLVLGAFAGLRTAEVQRQLWTDIHLDADEIVVTAEKGNTAQNRIVPISENLKEWLKLCRQTSDTCCGYGRTAEAINRLSKRAGIAWKHNGLRHSFISYRVAQTEDVPKVALEAGNSPQMIFRHYRKPLPPRAAPNWFAITPESVKQWHDDKVAKERQEPTNIVKLPKAA
jgi:integrase